MWGWVFRRRGAGADYECGRESGHSTEGASAPQRGIVTVVENAGRSSGARINTGKMRAFTICSVGWLT